MENTTRAQRLINDCLWCLDAAPLGEALLPHYQLDGLSEMKDSLDFEEEQQRLLSLHQDSKSHFLGPYYERIWLGLLSGSDHYEVVAHNLQVNHQGRTIGEFDLITKHLSTGTYVHLELAIKFYLKLVKNDQVFWVGPNGIDRLDLKVQHLLENQLRLSEHHQSQSLLHSLGIERLQKGVLLQGFLFEPMHGSPDGHARRTDSLVWISASELEKSCSADDTSHWIPLDKVYWISSLTSTEIAHLDKFEMPVISVSDTRARYWARVHFDGIAWTEIERCFVVPDQWLESVLDSIPRQPWRPPV